MKLICYRDDKSTGFTVEDLGDFERKNRNLEETKDAQRFVARRGTCTFSSFFLHLGFLRICDKLRDTEMCILMHAIRTDVSVEIGSLINMHKHSVFVIFSRQSKYFSRSYFCNFLSKNMNFHKYS